MASKRSPAKPPAPSAGLKTADIVFKGKRSDLSKAQRAFLAAKNGVERLQKELADTAVKLEKLLARHAELVAPRLETITGLQKNLIAACAALLSGEGKPPKKVIRRKLAECILELFASLFDRDAPLDDALLKLHDDIRETYFPQPERSSGGAGRADGAESGADQAFAKSDDDFISRRRFVETMLFMQTGQTFDLEGLRPDMSQEEADAYIADLLDKHPANPKNRKKTKRQLEKEEQEKRTEAAHAKNINTVYRQLARLFHPDLEQDPALKAKKEVLMKELTAAYENGDLHTILRLELRWLQNNDGDITRLSDAKLDAYTAALKQQCDELSDEIANFVQQPRFSPLRSHLLGNMWRLPLFTLTKDLQDNARYIDRWADALTRDTETLERIRAMPAGDGREQALRAAINEFRLNLVDQTDAFRLDFPF
jgi:curved DNA-binding protein CbpA